MRLKRWLSPFKEGYRAKVVALLLVLGLLLAGFTTVVAGLEGEMVELRGVVKFVEDLGGPHYDLCGAKLQGDAELLAKLEGQCIIARGYRVDEASIFMKDIIRLVDYKIIPCREQDQDKNDGQEKDTSPPADEVTHQLDRDTITLYWGEKPSSGYEITIKELEVAEERQLLIVHYELRVPAQGEEVLDVITYPSASAQIPGDYREISRVLLQNVTEPVDAPDNETPDPILPVAPPVEDDETMEVLQARNNIWDNRLILTLKLAEKPEQVPESNDFELSRVIYIDGQSQEGEVLSDHEFFWNPHEQQATFILGAVHPGIEDQEVRISVNYGESLYSVDFPVGKIREWGSNGVVSERKEWTITFNMELNPATVNEKTIFVTGTDGSPLYLQPSVARDGSDTIVKVPAPAVSYTRGAGYYLYITDQVQSASGAPLSHFYRMFFQIEAPQPPPAENDENTLVLEYTFGENLEGWDGCFAELPADYEEDIYRLEFGYAQLPQELGLERRSLYISSNNASDDVFMFIKRQVGQLEGLKPHTTYQIRYELDLATNAPAGAVGIGGAPGEAVYVKVGASLEEPRRVDVNGFYEMNIDKGGGNQSEGRNALLIGNVAKKSPDFNYDYEIKTLDNLYRPLEITTDESGTLWLLAGTDSGFEGTTSLFYTRVMVLLTEV